jgi:hypothetical protein
VQRIFSGEDKEANVKNHYEGKENGECTNN